MVAREAHNFEVAGSTPAPASLSAGSTSAELTDHGKQHAGANDGACVTAGRFAGTAASASSQSSKSGSPRVSVTTTKRAPITFAELAAQTLGTTVTWQELIPLIEAATNVQVCFYAHDGKEYLGRSLDIPKEAALKRARWAAEQHPVSSPESVNVSACAGTLWFGGH